MRLGIAHHLGWAIVVTASLDHEVVDRRRIEQYYDRAVAYVDGELGRLFAALRQRREHRPVLAALTSDHGEEFWDHGSVIHSQDFMPFCHVGFLSKSLMKPKTSAAGRAMVMSMFVVIMSLRRSRAAPFDILAGQS